MKKVGFLKLCAAALALVMLVLGGIALAAPPAPTFTALTTLASTSADLESPFKAVYDEASQSIVGIKLTTQLTTQRGRISQDTAYVGSGVVVSDEGHVVTNYHVVTALRGAVATDITVVHGDDEYIAKYIAGDEATDVAVLQVKGLRAPAARLGNSDEISIGDWALVIGNPLGETFVNTLTVGVISGKNRDMTTTNRQTGKRTGTEMIQTNAQVNSGNSGGGLFNIRGELVGITSMKLSTPGFYSGASIEGFGFAIPVNTVTEIMDDLIAYGEVRAPAKPRIGIEVEPVQDGSDEPSKETLPSSIWVRGVEDGSPAERAGIQVDDLIYRADGKRVKEIQDLLDVIQSHAVGETVEIEVYRISGVRSVMADQEIPECEYITIAVDVQILDD